MTTHPDPPVSEILTRQRIADAFASLTQPEGAGAGVQLATDERRSIARAVDQSAHPLGAFARTILDEWDQLDSHDQVAGLLLFTEITNQSRQRTRQLGVER
jgi:hypothetical protein